jgi:hypothetical protein
MTLADVMAREREALMTEYLFEQGLARVQVPPYSAVPDFEVLIRTPTTLRTRHPVRVDELSGARRGRAFVQICPSLNYKFLWVHADNDDYRADYVTFLQNHYGMSIQALPEAYHVDHLYNRARARQLALPYIRLVLLPREVNTSHGAGYEKSRTLGGLGTPGNQRGIDEISLMKLWGVATPRKGMPLSPEIVAHARRMSMLFGIPPAEIERNIRELMDVASFRPGL